MEYGIGIGGPMAMIGPMAQMVEAAGFESCWAAETTTSSLTAPKRAEPPGGPYNQQVMPNPRRTDRKIGR